MAIYILAMGATTIQISRGLLEELRNRKMYDNESYEEVIRDLIEDTMELSEETKRVLAKSEEDVRKGNVYFHDEIKKEFGL